MSVSDRFRNRWRRVKPLVVQPVDSALGRLERLAGTPSSATKTRIRLTCVFLQWDPDRAPAELDALRTRLGSMSEVESTVVVVDNRTPGSPATWIDSTTLTVGGDNSAYEFSGLQAGIEAARAQGMETDVWLLANDRYRGVGVPFLRNLTRPTIEAAMALPDIVGHLDSYPRTVVSFGYPIQRWITTSLFLVSDNVLKRCSPLVSVTAADLAACLDETDLRAFTAGGPGSSGHAAFLAAWLTGADETEISARWYGWAPVDALEPAVLRRKVQSILNEQLLSAKALASGIALMQMQDAHRLATLGFEHPIVQQERRRILRDAGPDGIAPTSRPHRLRLALQLIMHRRR